MYTMTEKKTEVKADLGFTEKEVIHFCVFNLVELLQN